MSDYDWYASKIGKSQNTPMDDSLLNRLADELTVLILKRLDRDTLRGILRDAQTNAYSFDVSIEVAEKEKGSYRVCMRGLESYGRNLPFMTWFLFYDWDLSNTPELASRMASKLYFFMRYEKV